tara:strand:+ start:52 stop:234 length:183 start_codon:yes stop_codon:yes gene_type:complete
MHNVAPITGAWIETQHPAAKSAFLQSRPSRARGLKPSDLPDWNQGNPVAPITGAWIEIPE